MFSLPIINFILNYGYLAILAGAFFEGESILIIGGLAVHQGLLDLPLVFLCSFVGTLASDNLFFFLGRFHGHQLVAKYKFFSRLGAVSEKMSGKKGPFLAFGMRFMYGFRHLMPFSLGMSNLKTSTFFFCNLLGGMCWVLAVGFAGYFFGDLLQIFLGRVRHYEFRAIVIVILALGVSHLVYKMVRNRFKNFAKQE